MSEEKSKTNWSEEERASLRSLFRMGIIIFIVVFIVAVVMAFLTGGGFAIN